MAISLQSLLGIVVLTTLAWALSENRRTVSTRMVLIGLGMQLTLAVILLELPLIRELMQGLNGAVLALQASTKAGTSFIFGYVGGGDAPFEMKNPANSFIFAFQALPLILLVSALSALLFHWRILPLIVEGFAWVLRKSLNIGGALGVGVAANVFVGMVEAPLLIRPYLQRMTRSELFTLMTCGMATIAGTMMALYAMILGQVIPNALGHILTASIISAPAALTVAMIMVPETQPVTPGRLDAGEIDDHTAMGAITRGTSEGVALLIQVIAMLLVMVALVALVNQMLGALPDLGGEPFTMQRILGWIMAPVTWLMGVPWNEAHGAGALMGTKTILNEFVAYLNMAAMPPEALSPRSRLIMTYAMCGFANFGSLGIMIAGLSSMAPNRRPEIVGLGMKSILSGTLATCLTGAVVGLITT
ncbi:MAG: nucleoside:proton symporter [Magnetococcales bacterium]|nr:nucleoside:proton symporter [Magnetococcales bacterium]